MSSEISNSEDIIDSRDVIARIEELEGERDACEGEERERWEESEDAGELRTLTALAEEGASSSDWTYGETLIRDSYFEQYAEELAHDIGAVNREATWPNNFIDWEAAANALKMDYTQVDFDGVEYWTRS